MTSAILTFAAMLASGTSFAADLPHSNLTCFMQPGSDVAIESVEIEVSGIQATITQRNVWKDDHRLSRFNDKKMMANLTSATLNQSIRTDRQTGHVTFEYQVGETGDSFLLQGSDTAHIKTAILKNYAGAYPGSSVAEFDCCYAVGSCR